MVGKNLEVAGAPKSAEKRHYLPKPFFGTGKRCMVPSVFYSVKMDLFNAPVVILEESGGPFFPNQQMPGVAAYMERGKVPEEGIELPADKVF
jgi:hypothetical protein